MHLAPNSRDKLQDWSGLWRKNGWKAAPVLEFASLLRAAG